MIKCIVVDDEPPALDLVAGYVAKTPFLDLVGKYSNPVLALQKLSEGEINLLYLDINMPDLTGLELSKLIDKKIKVVFTTAYESYALESYKVDALDYLLKPFSFEEFLRSAQKAFDFFQLMARNNNSPEPDYIFVKANYKINKVRFNEILFIENIKDYVKIHLSDGSSLMSLMNLKLLEDNLPKNSFMKIHRSFIVNLSKVDVIDHGRIVFGKHYLPVSGAYKEQFTQFLENRMFQR